MKEEIKLTDDNLQEYTSVLLNIQHDEDFIFNVEFEGDSQYAKELKNENKKLEQIVDFLHELAFLNASSQGEE